MTKRLRSGVLTAALVAGSALLVLEGVRAAVTPHVVADDPVATGRYLVNYGGCNDCHTPGRFEGKPTPPEAQRLTGNPIGFMGPWGVSYAPNLRLALANMTPAQFTALIANPGPLGKPPMPWDALQALSPGDQQAILAYIKSLGPTGTQAPSDVPPGQTPTTAYLIFAPTTPTPSR
jgi:mono/diheme cytochrome c family protein